jgi:serine/threonine protein kinase
MTEPEELEPPQGPIAGKYRLTRLLGRGGMGTVWEGVHEQLGTRVAVKFIDAEHAASEDVRQRFVNEARAAARLRSKHVVQVYDQGVGHDGRPYIVMEFLAGEPLDSRLDREGRLAPAEVARIVLHVSRALAKAHESGIVHRDLKPENVFLVHDDEDHTVVAKVVDFGIAKFTDPSGPGSSSTRTGAVLGTPQYMSPEQARGLRTVDHRTDLWSLGIIVYRAIVGELPFKGEAVGDLLVNICTSEPPLPSRLAPDVPAGFDAWVKRALAREPASRFQSAAELTDTFSALAGVDARLGVAPSSREARVVVRESAAKPAVTASALSTTSVPTTRASRPKAVTLALLFVLVTGGVVFGARALLRPVGTVPAAERTAEPARPAASMEAAVVPAAPLPAVTPVVSAGPAPPNVREAAPVASAPASGARRRPRGAAPGETKPGEKTPHPPHASGDLLGY